MKFKKTLAGALAATTLAASAVTAGAAGDTFKDVSSTAWYAQAVNEAHAHNLVNGMTSNTFAPSATMTRAMTVQILYNYAGRPSASGSMQFRDVASNSWYYDAVKWAVSNGITNGTSATTFSPEDKVTREQFATFLYNYAGKKDASGTLNFPDAGNVSNYAKTPMLWATQNKVLNGYKDNNGVITLNPKGSTLRAEAAQLLVNYLDITDGHTYKKTDSKAATCTASGYTKYTCTTCGYEKTEKIAQLAHEYTSEVTTEATCGKDGVKTYTCSSCNHSYTEAIPATGDHKYTSEVTTEATCEEDGVKTYTCSGCDKTYTEAIPATGHDYSDAVVTKEATCTEDGEKTGTCKECKKTYTEVIPATGHSWDEGEVTTEATCEEDGVKTYTCANCDETKTEVIPATGHSWDEGKVTTEATCEKAGVKTYTCANCDETKTEVIPATGNHEYTSEVTTKATCTEAGVKTYTCSGCGKTYTETIPATGHDYVEKITKEAACRAEGEKQIVCANCGDVKSTEVIPELGHNYEDTVIREATCEHGGITKRVCTRCKYTLTNNYVDGHKWELQYYEEWGVPYTGANGRNWVYANQCNNCFKYFDIGTVGKTHEIHDHFDEGCDRGVGNGWSVVQMPLYKTTDENGNAVTENTPGAKKYRVETGYKCTKCGRERRQSGGYYS